MPDLAALLRLPQDELIEIVRRFRNMHEAGGTPQPRRIADYRRWLAALETLDFASLSRNAQIDYLFIKRTSQFQIERAAVDAARQPAAQDRTRAASPAPRAAARGSSGICRTRSSRTRRKS